MKKSDSFVSVIVPIETNINISVLSSKISEIQTVLQNGYNDYEIILLVNKNMYELCNKTISQLLENIPCIRYLQLSGDIDHEVIYSSGVENAIGDFVICFNISEDPITLINESILLCSKGHDVIVGVSEENSSICYKILRPFVSGLLNMVDYKLPKGSTDFRCLSRRAVNAIIDTSKFQKNFFMRVQKTGYGYEVLQYVKEFSCEKKGVVNSAKLLFNLAVFNSLKPLRVISMLGILASFMGFAYACFSFIARFFVNAPAAGWTSTVFAISFFFMIQFIILSFISEYLARLLEENGNSSSISVVFEKNSACMIDLDRINVLDSSESSELNLTKTGRDR